MLSIDLRLRIMGQLNVGRCVLNLRNSHGGSLGWGLICFSVGSCFFLNVLVLALLEDVIGL